MADPSPPVADSADPARLLALGLGDDDVPDVGEIDLAPFLCARPDLELLECLGRGGMGVVHKARQTSLDRWVAVKLMSPRLAKEPAFADRFAREARAMARLDHPGLVRVIDFGDADGLFYLVMEHVDGTDLRRMMAERLPTEQALAIVEQLCDALDYAHSEGVVHRDIKPENVLVDRRGRVRIADFGLAKLQTDPEIRSLTASRVVMGTPQYMAPEQLETPTDVDHRADLFALGVVFYEMLTGHLPIGRFALPSELDRGDPGLDDVVIRSLERDRELRFQHASQLRDALRSGRVDDPSQGTIPAGARPRQAPRRSIRAAGAAVGLGVVLAGSMSWALWQPSDADPQPLAASDSAAVVPPAVVPPEQPPDATAIEPAAVWTERWPDRELAFLDPTVPIVVGIDWAEIRQAPLAYPGRAALAQMGAELATACGEDPLAATDKLLAGIDDENKLVEVVISGRWTTEALVACNLSIDDDGDTKPVVTEVGPYRRISWKGGDTPLSVLVADDGRGHMLLSTDETLDEAGVAERFARRGDTTLWQRLADKVDRDAPVWMYAEFDDPRSPLAIRGGYGSLGFWDDITMDLSLVLSHPGQASNAEQAVRGWVASAALLKPDVEISLDIGHEGDTVWVRGPLPWRLLDIGEAMSHFGTGKNVVITVGDRETAKDLISDSLPPQPAAATSGGESTSD